MASWNDPASRLSYLGFRAGGRDWAVDVLSVREVLEWRDLGAPSSKVPGSLRLGGCVVPVVELAVEAGLPPGPVTAHTCVLVVEGTISGSGAAEVTGLVVDEVTELVELGPADVEPPPAAGAPPVPPLVAGLARVGGRTFHLLDVGRPHESVGGGAGESPR
jgi:purine-binding chemotaxis protein CheW